MFEAAALCVAAIALVAFRLHAFDLPLETDECNYAYIGARLLAGDRMYADVWDHQPPGVFILFAGLIAAFGNDPQVFRWAGSAFSVGTLLLIYAIVRRLAGRPAAVSAALLFAVVSADPGTGGEGVNREIYMNTLILAAWYCAIRWAGWPTLIHTWQTSPQSYPHVAMPRSPGAPDGLIATGEPAVRLWLLAAGLALGLASTVKTIVAIQWFFLTAWVVWLVFSMPSGRRSSAVKAMTAILWIAMGPATVWLVAFAYFAATGRLGEFVDAVFVFNLGYSEGGSGFYHRFAAFFQPPRHPFIFDSAQPLWIAAAGSTLLLSGWAIVRRNAAAALIAYLVLSSYLAVCMPGRFWPHYYYLLIPPAVIVVATGVRLVILLLERMSGSAAGAIPAAILLGLAPLGALWTEYSAYLSQPPFGITVKRYNSRDFWGRAQGQNVGRVTNPDDRVFVYGNEAEIYYYSDRRCASRYTMITGVSAGLPGAGRRREKLMAELRADPPRLILVVFDQEPFDEWLAFLREHYGEPVGWDRHDRTGEPIMFVLARKDRPIEAIDWDWDRSSVGGWHLGEDRRP